MPSELMRSASRAFGVVAERGGARVESRSGAGVQAVRTDDGAAAYLKVTPAALGAHALAAARRELRFYHHLAPTAPVRTPLLLDSLDGEDGVALLLAAAGHPQEAASWTEKMWATLGQDLAALHAMPRPGSGAEGDLWGRPDALLDALDAPDLARITAFWADALPRLPDLLARRAELREQVGALPEVFVHGDCHTGNVVHAEGSPVLCDWQSAGVGRPAGDLAFLSVRATPSGVTVPTARSTTLWRPWYCTPSKTGGRRCPNCGAFSGPAAG